MEDTAAQAIASLRRSLRVAAASHPDRLAALAKDAGVLAKLLRNPAEHPGDPKFRKVKLANATVARVLSNAGVREVLVACGFAGDAAAEHLELHDVPEAALLKAVEAVEAVQHMLLELQWLYDARQGTGAAGHWAPDEEAKTLVQACLRCLHSDVTDKVPWVRRLHHILYAVQMRECREAVMERTSVAVTALRRVALELLHAGAFDVPALVLTNQCLAWLWPPAEPSTLQARIDFCLSCLEAVLPADDGPLELRLRLTRGNLLGSTIQALGAFSEVGVRSGVLRQELKIEYAGEKGQDAGGLLRQYFDLLSGELARSKLWTHTAAGGLRPVDDVLARAAAASSSGHELRAHMETCGRCAGMALAQELHRRRRPTDTPAMVAGTLPASLFGASFAHHFIRAVQHDPPASLAELQAELRAESDDSQPDYRASAQILTRGVAESGIEGETFVRVVGGVQVPLVAGGRDVAVSDENKLEWLQRSLHSELVDGFTEMAAFFRGGLLDVVGLGRVDPSHAELCRWTTPFFFLLSAAELQYQWSGAPVTQDFVEELRGAAVVHADVGVQADWFWEVMLAFNDEQRAKAFRFVTGSSRRPRDGLAHFRIGPKPGGDGAYPFAHACANALDMPCYSSRQVLRARLEAAIEAAHDTFTDL
jgi:hypothetical protein